MKIGKEDKKMKQLKKMLLSVLASMMLVTTLVGCSSNESKDETAQAANRLEEILQRGYLVVATSPDFPPNEFIDVTKSGNDQYVGSDIEFAKYIAEQLGVELRLEVMEFNAVCAAVTSGKADLAISGLAYTEDRANTMELSKGYNFGDEGEDPNCQGLLIRAKDMDAYKTMDDFTSKIVAAQFGSLQEQLSLAQISNVQIENISTLELGIMSLKTEKVDAMACACKTAQLYAENNDDLMVSDVHFVTEDTNGTRIGIMKGETELTEKINEIIDDVLDQGLYVKWYKEATDYAAAINAN